MRSKTIAALLLALCLACAMAFSEDGDVSAAPVEADIEETTFDLGGGEEDPPETEPPAPEVTEEPEAADAEECTIPYPDIYDYKGQFKPSERVYPGALVWPLKGETPLTHLTSHVGWRDAGRIHRHQGGAWASWLHHGVDVGGVGYGHPVVAAASGLAWAGCRRGNGNYVVVDHGNGWYTEYQHLSGFAKGIAPGAGIPVQAGETIGYVGNSGGDYPVHFHFEIAWSPEGGGADDQAYHVQTRNWRIRAYSFPQECVVTMHWPKTWELCTAEAQRFVSAPEDPDDEQPVNPGGAR